ncbi:Aste57867_14789 [Aphanomyces stellatus]|uniref:Aste57867_14789 protein n=1 Tax=Aphanomyces stellatus TaxID=120398 RepID=A0A485L1W6_9STRA|nr:hypothetical protein As57867_014734 [Aphanomyces stellatus]VFT91607.1 Aste57867_14789 [Aphanomyces stellatus]
MHPRVLHEQSESELYETVVQTRQEKLRSQLHKVAGQKAFLRHEHRRLMLQRALLESEYQRYQASLTSDWFCHEDKSTTKERLRLQVGGQDFELSLHVARKDPKSLLAALVAPDSPLGPSEVGCFCIDRDWNLFRLILNFLRDGILPNDPKLLRDLYIECEFWKLESLKLAIEQGKIQLKITKPGTVVEGKANASASSNQQGSSGNSGNSGNKSGNSSGSNSGASGNSNGNTLSNSANARQWWNEPPQWWGRSTQKATETKKDERPDPYAWWKGTKYKGNDYAKFLSDQVATGSNGQRSTSSGGGSSGNSNGGGNSGNGGGSTSQSSGSSLAQSLFNSNATKTSTAGNPSNTSATNNSSNKKDEYPMLRSTWTSFHHLT